MDEITPEKAQTSPLSSKRRNKGQYNEFCDGVVGFPSAEELPLAAVEFEFTRTVICPLRHRSGHFDRSGTARPGAAHSSSVQFPRHYINARSHELSIVLPISSSIAARVVDQSPPRLATYKSLLDRRAKSGGL
jgi:hypothetical protein